jgi:GNAT superfamily N-acetyltransferase
LETYPLSRTNRLRIAEAFRNHLRVDMSIDCVIEDQMGKAYVDNVDKPTFFFLELSGFFGYFAGDATDEAANFAAGHMIMPSSDGWSELLESVHGDKAIKIERYRYTTERLNIAHLDNLSQQSPVRERVQRIGLELLQKSLSSADNYLSIDDFDSPEDFITRGVGFCVQKNDTIIGVAYSSLVCSKGIEVSIVVHPDYRQQGIATALSCCLLKHCLERGLKPNWDAANAESDGLAQKLGYTFAEKYEAYFIKS